MVLLAFGRRLGEPVAGGSPPPRSPARSSCAVVTWLGLLARNDRSVTITLFDWLPLAGSQVKVAFLVDPLSVTMCLFVTGVSALIHLYSIGYMHGERDYTKFFVYLNLFVFSMLLLVLANNLLITFIGWEGVGRLLVLARLVLLRQDSAASAGKKAFIYNRVGDVGFLVAMFFLFTHLHTLTYLGIATGAPTLSSTDVTLVVLLLLLAAAGKSAQIPLFNWLPDAMEGPTPVSALIHAATMVTAGVYLLCRMNHVLDAQRLGTRDDRGDRRGHGVRRRDDRHLPARHQEGARVLDGLPDRLHGARRRLGRLRRGDLPHGRPRLLQGAALPRRGLGRSTASTASRSSRRMGGLRTPHGLDLRARSSSDGSRSRASRRSRRSSRRATC